MSGFLDYYGLLQVPADADAETIKKKFRSLAQEYHPDKNSNSDDSRLLFRSILEAYKVLSSAGDRRAYDNYLRTSRTVKKRRYDEKPKTQNIDRTVEDIKSQLNYILWELEDLLDGNISRTDFKIGNESVDNIILRILTFFDKWILHPTGHGDYFFTARQLDVHEPYNPLDNELNRAHKPYVNLDDYFFQVRRRFDRFMNQLRKSGLSEKIAGTDATLMDSIFEAVNMSFYYLGAVNMAKNGNPETYGAYIFSNGIFDENMLKTLPESN